MIRAFLFLFASLALSLPVHGNEKTVVQSTNYPLHYFAERLATESFELNYRVDAEVDPAFWKPSKTDVVEFQKADLILKNGADYEKWMQRVSLKTSPQVDTSKAFSAGFLKTQGKEHRHGDGSVHSHAGTAFTTWMDLSQAAMQAEAIASRFGKARPADAATIEKNLASLLADLSSLDGRLKAFGKAWGDTPLVASHPIYQYFARAYGLRIVATVTDSDATAPGAAHLSALRAGLADSGAVCLFPEANHADDFARVVIEGTTLRLGAPLDPEGMAMDGGPDLYPRLMRALAAAIADCAAGR